MNTTRLIIVRHGNTFAPGETPRRVGITDLPLVASGEAQAEKLAHHFMEQQMLPDQIITSTLMRTKRMAEIIQDQTGHTAPCTAQPLFDEIDYGPDENQPEDAVIARIGQDALSMWALVQSVRKLL